MFKDEQWCSKHNRALTGFTSLFCPQCVEEETKSSENLEYAGKRYEHLKGSVILWRDGFSDGRYCVEGVIKTSHGERYFEIAEPHLVNAFKQFALGRIPFVAHFYGEVITEALVPTRPFLIVEKMTLTP